MERKKGCSIFFADVYNLLFLLNAITIRWLGYKKVKNGKNFKKVLQIFYYHNIISKVENAKHLQILIIRGKK